MDPPPVNNRTEGTKGDNLPQLVALFESSGPKRSSDVVTGDECWISFFTMKDKHSNMVLLAEDEPRPKVPKQVSVQQRECSPISSILRGLLFST